MKKIKSIKEKENFPNWYKGFKIAVREMTTKKSLREKVNFLNWYLGFRIMDLAESKFLSKKETRALIDKRFSEVENLEAKLEAYNDTHDFRKECVILEHGYADACGSNYDYMLVEYKGEKYIINDRMNTVTLYKNKFS